jgi:hypothetical protein
LRDFALELEDEDGEKLSAEQYLDQCLRPQQGYDAGVAERNKIRRALTTFFQVCLTMKLHTIIALSFSLFFFSHEYTI